MIDHGKRNVIGIEVDSVDYANAVARIVDCAKNGRRCSTTALAVHGLVTGAKDPAHRFRLNHFDLVLPDGQPVRWALNLLYRLKLPDRVYGPKLTLQLCKAAAADGIPVYFYGSTENVLKNLCARMTTLCPGLLIAAPALLHFAALQTTSESPL